MWPHVYIICVCLVFLSVGDLSLFIRIKYPAHASLLTLMDIVIQKILCISGWSNKKRNAPSTRGPGSVVGIVTGYGLDGPGIESRWGRDFSATVQTGPGAHPASCTMGTGSLSG